MIKKRGKSKQLFFGNQGLHLFLSVNNLISLSVSFSRIERRWIEKQNKQARAKLKKEEMARIRTVVDNAYALDPRIARFKEEEAQKKLEKKLARQNAVKQKQLEEQKVILYTFE